MTGGPSDSGTAVAPRLGTVGLSGAALLVLCWTWALAWQATFGGVSFMAWPHAGLYALAAASAGCGLLWWWVRFRPRDPECGQRRADRPSGIGRTVLVLGALALALVGASLVWDAWWHGHRGPTRYFLTPPHAVAAAAVLAVVLQWVAVNRASPAYNRIGEEGRRSTHATALLGGMVLLWLTTLGTEYVGRPNYWHGSEFYLVAGALFPVVLVAFGRGSRHPFGATLASLVYLAGIAGLYALLWFLPPSAVSGKEGDAVPHFVLPHVPVLLVIPAVVIDGLVSRWGPARETFGWLLRAGVLGGVFVGLLLASHWPLASGLVPRMDTGLLARTWPFYAESSGWRTQFWNLDSGTIAFLEGLVLAAGLAAAGSGVGLWLGDRLRRPVRGPEPEV